MTLAEVCALRVHSPSKGLHSPSASTVVIIYFFPLSLLFLFPIFPLYSFIYFFSSFSSVLIFFLLTIHVPFVVSIGPFKKFHHSLLLFFILISSIFLSSYIIAIFISFCASSFFLLLFISYFHYSCYALFFSHYFLLSSCLLFLLASFLVFLLCFISLFHHGLLIILSSSFSVSHTSFSYPSNNFIYIIMITSSEFPVIDLALFISFFKYRVQSTKACFFFFSFDS